MNFLVLFICFLIKYVKGNVANDFIFDYYIYKKATAVVGYSCNNITDDFLLMKHFNKNGMTATFNVWTDKTGKQFVANARYYKIGVFLDTRCRDLKSVESLYLDATNRRIYGELHYWLLLSNDLTGVLKDINDNAFGTSTDLVIAVHTGLEYFHLYDVYNKFKERGCTLNVTYYGYWSSQTGIKVSLLQRKSARRSNLYGVKVKVIFYETLYRSKNTSLEEYYKDNRDFTKDGRVRFGYSIIKNLADLYNFTIEFYESENWVAGDPLGPLVRLLMNSSVDLAGTSIVPNSERAKFIKFLHQGWPFRTCFIFRNPQPKTIKVKEISRPFADSVWFLMGLFILLGIIILALALQSENKIYFDTSVADSFTMTIGAACQQCTDIKIERLSTRIVFLTVMLFSFIMYNYYSASVVSARLDEPIYKINDSLVELGKLNLKLASEHVFFLNLYYAAPHWEPQTFKNHYWFKIPESQQFMDPEKAIQLVRKGQLAYHVHPDVAYALIGKHYDNREICELMEVHWIPPIATMFSATKNSTFEEILKIGFAKITEVGLRHRQIKRRQYSKPTCRKGILNASSLNMNEFATHLILLLVGSMCAFIIYAIENLIFNQKIVVPSDFYQEKDEFNQYESIL